MSTHSTITSHHKDNIMTGSNKHHNYDGLYFSWGNKANYGRKGNSSLGQYATKPSKEASLCGKVIMEMMNAELKLSIWRMNKVINHLDKMMASVMNVAHDMQATEGNIGIQKTSASKAGVWQSLLCINPVTKGWHTEDDVIYTIISVPSQQQSCKDRDIISFSNCKVNTHLICH